MKKIILLATLLSVFTIYAQDPNILWQRTIGGSGEDICTDIISTNDGGYIIAGMSDSDISGEKSQNSKGESDYWIVKLNINGDIDWQKTIGGEGEDHLRVILHSNDGGYILGGDSTSNISSDKTEDSVGLIDYWIVKITSTGSIEWQNTIGGTGHDILYSLIATSDGGYLLGGSSNSNISGDKTENSNGEFDIWIVKIDSLGNIIWQNTIGGSLNDGATAITKTINGGFLLSASSESNISGDKTENSQGYTDYWAVGLNDLGIITWQNTLGGDFIDVPSGGALETENSVFVLAGQSASSASGDKTEESRGGVDYWALKLNGVLNLSENPFATDITLYPNPTKNTLQLNTQDKTINQINIYTLTGSKVLQLDVETVSPTVDVSSLATGVYYIQLYSGKNVALKKFVKE